MDDNEIKSEEITDETAENVTEETTEVTEEVTEEVTDEVTEEVTDEVTEEVKEESEKDKVFVPTSGKLYAWNGREFAEVKRKKGTVLYIVAAIVAIALALSSFVIAITGGNGDNGGNNAEESKSSLEVKEKDKPKVSTESEAENEKPEVSVPTWYFDTSDEESEKSKSGKSKSEKSKADESESEESEESEEISRPDYPNSGNIITHSKSESEKYETLEAMYDALKGSCCSVCVPYTGGYYFGSGFVVDAENGYIVTNQHVIAEAESTVTVIFYDGAEYVAEIVGSDELTDIAVLKINAKNLVAISLGDSNETVVGEEVTAIGSPNSIALEGTFTNGVISGINRRMSFTTSSGKERTMVLLQTNTNINYGNSGGPLINAYGQVIGINVMKIFSDYEGLGFSIPMSYAVTVINDLIDYGKAVTDTGLVCNKARLNITVYTGYNRSDYAKMTYSVSDDAPDGILIIDITEDATVYKKGMRSGDIITSFNGKNVITFANLSSMLSECSAGDEATVTVYRMDESGEGGKYLTFTFNLEEAE